ncbi:MAG: hypothetical protein GY736_20060 [Sphingomonas sp.]|uniref:hypothetical protein n=1 Tax=Sphingomonas sp. TaxID=28214 RepID=UPI002582D9FB|nr:hypothetical protein [Sphingomonas sp.]MCP4028585.1 hypothetical protein [Sphingomonas sp.]
MGATIIQSLAALRSSSMDRQEPIDLIKVDGDWERHETMLASRSWSRQSIGLGDAILAQPPENVADALSVLLVAQQVFEEELIMGEEAPEKGRAARVCEQIRIALANCVTTIAAEVPPSTDLERQAVACAAKQREWWLPSAAPETAA